MLAASSPPTTWSRDLALAEALHAAYVDSQLDGYIVAARLLSEAREREAEAQRRAQQCEFDAQRRAAAERAYEVCQRLLATDEVAAEIACARACEGGLEWLVTSESQ